MRFLRSALDSLQKSRLRRMSGLENAEYLRGKGYRIGDHCSIPSGTGLPLPELIEIGNNVRFANGVLLLPYDGSIAMLGRATGERFDSVAPVRILDNVFVGSGSFILPGVTLGPNVVVGCNSTVTKDFENMIIGGAPAKAIRSWDSHLEACRERTASYPWNDLIQSRTGAFDPDLEPELMRRRVAYFFPTSPSRPGPDLDRSRPGSPGASHEARQDGSGVDRDLATCGSRS
ncbi:acyltransferase [Tundrisphaera lichenicola]|uniref:acyltransferase n=1 Tax=Tundrisphaera lichenicola TaxID=2029860 RepID=UPI003EB7A57F